MNTEPVLTMTGYSGTFPAPGGGRLPVLEDVSFSIAPNVITAVVGETASGKTLTALSMIGLTPTAFRRTGGSILFGGQDLTELDERAFRRIRGARIALVLPGSRSAPHPRFTIGT